VTDWQENRRQYDSAGELTEMQVQISDGHPFVWTFDASRIVVVLEGAAPTSPPYRVYDSPSFAFHPSPGSSAVNPRADLGLIEHNGNPYTWTTEGDLLVRVGEGERSTFLVDAFGKLSMLTHDMQDDGVVDITFRFTYDQDRLVEQVIEGGGGQYVSRW